MAHNHNIVENDPHFEINPHTREVTYTGEKAELLIQYDHNSERFTFRMPQMIEGHDMLISDRVEIHFKNLGSRSDEETSGVYFVSDLAQVEGTDQIQFSWLVGKESTVYAGTLKFIIRFVCLKEDGKVAYSWSTAVCSGKWIGEGMNNNNSIDEEYISTMTIRSNGVFDVSQFDKVIVSVGTVGEGDDSGGDFDEGQTLTLVNYNNNGETKSFIMPAGYTFEQFIGSSYDTSGGLFEILMDEDAGRGIVHYGGQTVTRPYQDSDGEPIWAAGNSHIASGIYYYGYYAGQLLILENNNNADEVEIFAMKEGLTFGQFINSAFDASGGAFTTTDLMGQTAVKYKGYYVVTETDGFVYVTVLAKGKYYFDGAHSVNVGE